LGQTAEKHGPIRDGEEAEESGKTPLLPATTGAALPSQQLVSDCAEVKQWYLHGSRVQLQPRDCVCE